LCWGDQGRAQPRRAEAITQAEGHGGAICAAMFSSSKQKAIITGCVLEISGCFSCWQGMPSRCMLSRTEKKLMSDAAVLQKVEQLTKAVEHLQERVEDLEDLRDLQAAIAENRNEPLIPWEQAKVELELD
jgi:hypothetical protein